jgi:hypothetical protein
VAAGLRRAQLLLLHGAVQPDAPPAPRASFPFLFVCPPNLSRHSRVDCGLPSPWVCVCWFWCQLGFGWSVGWSVLRWWKASRLLPVVLVLESMYVALSCCVSQCRCCGGVFCSKCSMKTVDLAAVGLPAASQKGFTLSAEDIANSTVSRVCDWCFSVLKLLPPLGAQSLS